MMLRMLKIDKFHLIVMLFPVFFYCFFYRRNQLDWVVLPNTKKLEKSCFCNLLKISNV